MLPRAQTKKVTYPESDNRVAWSVGEISRSYGLSQGFLRKQIREGRLKARRLGRRVLVLAEDLVQWVEADGAPNLHLEGAVPSRVVAKGGRSES